MISNMKKIIALSTFVMFVSSCYVQASNVSGKVTAVSNISFSKPSSISLGIYPTSDLTEGIANVAYHLALVKIGNSLNKSLALRWSPVSQQITDSNDPIRCILVGKNSKAELPVYFNTAGMPPKNENGWYIPDTVVSSTTHGDKIIYIDFDVSHTVAMIHKKADVYPMSIDAAVWTE